MTESPGDHSEVRLVPLSRIPLVKAGDDLAALLACACTEAGLSPEAGDVLVVAQKIVSKAEGRLRRLDDVAVSPRARELAATVGKDPRLVALILSETRRVVRAVPNLLIVEHRLGFIMANAGVDQSNVERSNVGPGGDPLALLLPEDPDASCARLRTALQQHFGVAIAVLMNDSFGRPWRNGVTGICIGAAGIAVLADRRGRPDLFGRLLRNTEIALGDEIAAAASLLMGQADEHIPAVLVRGLGLAPTEVEGAQALLRPPERDLFR
ncbi:MAG: coenzyme F420-0:L-glutamate ligase [Acetobacteraceae bacterium]